MVMAAGMGAVCEMRLALWLLVTYLPSDRSEPIQTCDYLVGGLAKQPGLGLPPTPSIRSACKNDIDLLLLPRNQITEVSSQILLQEI